MGHGTDQTGAQPTPVTDDAHATPQQLLARAAVDYRNGWGHPTARTTGRAA